MQCRFCPSTAVTHESTCFDRRSGSAIWVSATIEQEVEGYAVARIDLDEVRRQREELQVLQARQPSAYRSIVKQY